MTSTWFYTLRWRSKKKRWKKRCLFILVGRCYELLCRYFFIIGHILAVFLSQGRINMSSNWIFNSFWSCYCESQFGMLLEFMGAKYSPTAHRRVKLIELIGKYINSRRKKIRTVLNWYHLENRSEISLFENVLCTLHTHTYNTYAPRASHEQLLLILIC